MQWDIYRFLLAERGDRELGESFPNIRTLLLFDTRGMIRVLGLGLVENMLYGWG